MLTNTNIKDFPAELITHTLGYLDDPKDLGSAALVCSDWNRLVDEHLWRGLTEDYPDIMSSLEVYSYVTLEERVIFLCHKIRGLEAADESQREKLLTELKTLAKKLDEMPQFFWNDWKSGFTKTLHYLIGFEKLNQAPTFDVQFEGDYPEVKLSDMGDHPIKKSSETSDRIIVSILYKKADEEAGNEKILTIFERYSFKTSGESIDSDSIQDAIKNYLPFNIKTPLSEDRKELLENTSLVFCGDRLPKTSGIYRGELRNAPFMRALRTLIHRGEVMWYVDDSDDATMCKYTLVNNSESIE